MRSLLQTMALEAIAILLVTTMACQSIEEADVPPDEAAEAESECIEPEPGWFSMTTPFVAPIAPTPPGQLPISGTPTETPDLPTPPPQSWTPTLVESPITREVVVYSPEPEDVAEDKPICYSGPTAPTPSPRLEEWLPKELPPPLPSIPPCMPAQTGALPTPTIPPLDVEVRPSYVGLARWGVESGTCVHVEGVQIAGPDGRTIIVWVTLARTDGAPVELGENEPFVSDASGQSHPSAFISESSSPGPERTYGVVFPVDANDARDFLWRREGFADLRIQLFP
jgi:hypothetical protein